MRLLKRALGLAAAAALLSFAGQAQAKSKDEKLCSDLSTFKDSISRIANLGPENTVKDMQFLENQAEQTGRRIVSESHWDKHAKGLSSAIDDLDRSMNQLPPDTSLATAQQAVQGQVDEVTQAAKDFEQARCKK